MTVFKTLEQEVIDNEINALHQVKDSIESMINHTKKIQEAVYLKTYRKSFYFKDDPMKGLETVANLKNYEITNLNISELFLYFSGDDYIYTSIGTSPIRTFVNELFLYESMGSDQFFNLLNSIKETTFRPVEEIRIYEAGSEEYATVIYPLKFNLKKTYAVMGFVIPKSFFSSKIEYYIEDRGKTTVILDNFNRTVVSTGGTDIFEGEEFFSYSLGLTESSAAVITLNGNSYISTAVISKGTGWKYVTLTPSSEISTKTSSVRIIFLLGILIVILLGAGSIILFMNINYNPIKQLQDYSKEIFSDGERKGELDQVKDVIDYLSDQNIRLSDEVEQSGEANRQYITMQMIRGNLQKDRKLSEKAEKYGVSISGDTTVVIIHVDSHSDYAVARKEITNRVKEYFNGIAEIYSCEHFDNKKIIMIFNFNGEGYNSLQERLEEVKNQIRDEWNIPTVIGVGNLCTDSKSIPKAYIEATTAIDYKLVKGNDCVIFFKNIIEQQVALESYPHKQLDRIGIFLRAGNITALEGELDKVIEFIKNNNTTIFTARGLCFDIINMIFQTGQQLLAELNLGGVDIPDTFALTGYNTVDELIGVIRDLSRTLSRKIIMQKEIEDLSLINDMKDYIQNNYTDYNFSLMGMADVFNMSQSSLSTYFKEKTDQTILNYITGMKMGKCKELLRTTDLSISKVAEVVGYNNVTSFIRRFKQWEEQTPGDYRKKFK